jgi:hypothetical protein
LFVQLLLKLWEWYAHRVRRSSNSQPMGCEPARIAGEGNMPMSPTMKKVLIAIFWFVLGHLSCALMHHMHSFHAN